MSNWPLLISTGRFGPSSGVTVTSGISPAYGAWAQLSSSIPDNVVGVNLIRTTAPTGDRFTVNLGVGASGSEVIIAEDMLFAIGSTVDTTQAIVLPLKLPAGQRLAIQVSRVTSTANTTFRVEWITNPWLLPVSGSRIATYGFDLTAQLGTLLTSGTSAAFGTSVQVTSSTPRRARGMAITGWGVNNGVTLQGLVQCVIGTTTNPVGPVFAAKANTTTAFMNEVAVPRFVPCDIPSGTDLRLRLWNNAATASERYFQLHLLY